MRYYKNLNISFNIEKMDIINDIIPTNRDIIDNLKDFLLSAPIS